MLHPALLSDAVVPLLPSHTKTRHEQTGKYSRLFSRKDMNSVYKAACL